MDVESVAASLHNPANAIQTPAATAPQPATPPAPAGGVAPPPPPAGLPPQPTATAAVGTQAQQTASTTYAGAAAAAPPTGVYNIQVTFHNNRAIPASQLTPLPPFGIESIHGLSPYSILGGLTELTVDTWDEITDASVLILACYDRPSRHADPDTHRKLTERLKEFTTDNENLQLHTADLEPGYNAATPRPYLCTGAPKEQLDALTRRVHWSTPSISFIALPTVLPPSDLVMVLDGFFMEPNEKSEELILSLIGSLLRKSNKLAEWFMKDPEHHDLVPDTAFDIVDHITSILRVSPITVVKDNASRVLWRVYTLEAFTTSPRAMEEFIAIAKLIRYQGPFVIGVGKAKPTDWQCACCRGRDHPTGLCPLKQIPGVFDLDPNQHRPIQPPPAVDTPETSSMSIRPSLRPAAPNNNASRGHFTTSHQDQGRGRGRGRGRGGYAGRGRGAHANGPY
ncbi:hypothetical protein DFP72DRAFT_51907 [Ephemerocybe angulata]|uniref:Uncharacterized protein n=1 Tax=Ephemerocybe angulata TaxID=980116 RepID=A0A8H6LVH3_9AGAR|nr:hypothetical protein DFP72DRAFT_51907 [Tulosesus angulatus]